MKSTTSHKTPQSHHIRQLAAGAEPVKVTGLYKWAASDAAKKFASPFRRHGNLGSKKKGF